MSEDASAASALRARVTRTGCSTEPLTNIHRPGAVTAVSARGSWVRVGSGPIVGRPWPNTARMTAPSISVPANSFSQSDCANTSFMAVMARMSERSTSVRSANSASLPACARTAAQMDPADAPVITFGRGVPWCASSWTAPASKAPLVPPPESTNPNDSVMFAPHVAVPPSP